MNVLLALITVTVMQSAPTLLAASPVSVTLVTLGMEKLVLVRFWQSFKTVPLSS